jgi:hypothetical protein
MNKYYAKMSSSITNKYISLTSEIIRDLTDQCVITIIKKRQKDSSDSKPNFNYFITPNLRINLFNAKLLVSNPKFIVLQFDRYRDLSLLSLLKTVNTRIIDYLNRCYPVDCPNIYSLYSEQENTFTLRCYLPQVRSKYLISYEVDGEDCKYVTPRQSSIIDCVGIEIRNIWESGGKMGFNLEVKHMKN